MTGRNKRSSFKEAPKSQVPLTLPPPPPPTTTVNLLPYPNLKKKRNEQEMEEGEVVPQKEAKHQKTAKDKRASSVDSREDPSMALGWSRMALPSHGAPSLGSSREGTPLMLLKP